MSNVNVAESAQWQLTLFVAGTAAESVRARSNLDAMVGKYLHDTKTQVEVVDLHVVPKMARERNILALPTLIRESPGPESRVIGDLSNPEALWSVLQTG